MTPGQREPLATVTCASAGCHAVALGPGPDELTMRSSDGVLVVIGPDGRTRRNLGPAWTNAAPGQGFLHDEAWSPDGSSWAETRYEQRPDKASLTVLLRDPDSPDVTTLYRYSEPAPPWYHGGQRGDAGKLPGWGAPYVIDLQWTPDSTRLAFITITVRELAHRPAGTADGYQLRLFVADTTTGKVDQVADLGRCACNGYSPHLAWTPDGQSLTVFSHSTLIHYDLTGKQLDSAVADPPMGGPLAWLETE